MADSTDPKLPADSSANPALLALRQRIDALDRELLALLKQSFATTIHAKPKASRADSAETYLLARGFKGKPAAAVEE